MNQDRFDALTRLMASKTGRRAFLKSSAVVMAGAGGIHLVVSEHVTAQTPEPEPTPVSLDAPDGECVMPFEVAVREGPNAESEYRGLLYVTLDDEGAAAGRLEITGGAIAEVTGQITNQAVALRFELPDGAVLYGTGVANGDPSTCVIYDMGGPVVGPDAGDLGDWKTFSPEFDPNAPPLCVTGDPNCDPNVRPPGPEPTPDIPEFPGTCQFDPFTNCLYVCGSSKLRPRASDCLDYCIEIFQC